MSSFVESVLQSFLVDKFRDKPEEQVNFVRFEDEENIGELFGLASKMRFGRLVYVKNNENHMTESLAVKQTADEDWGEEGNYYSMQFTNEIHFFSKVVPTMSTLTNSKVESFFPQFLYSCSTILPNYDRNVIIYENLRALGFHMASSEKMQNDSSSEKNSELRAVFPDYAHLSLMMRKLGQFHAYSIAAIKINATHFKSIASFQPRLHENFIPKYSNFFGAIMKRYLCLLSTSSLYKEKLTSMEKIVEDLENCVSSVNRSNSVSVVCHGDYTVTNVLFKYDKNGLPEDMKMLDLGMWRLSSPVLDLSHLLYVNADQDMRDKHWDDLMNDYFKGLADILNGHDLPSRKEMMQEFHLSAWFAFLIASFFVVNRIAAAANVPNIFEEISNHFPGVLLRSIPTEELLKLLESKEIGGKRATEAVLNIIKDMVDRKFI